LSIATTPSTQRTPLAERLDLIVSPIFAIGLAILGWAVWFYSDVDETTLSILRPEKIQTQLVETILLGLASSVLVIVIAVPVGILVTRKGFPRLKSFLVNTLGVGQSLPVYGLIVIYFSWLGAGAFTVLIALATYSLLPVLRNTIVGLEQVDESVIDAARGMGLTSRQILTRIELPLAVVVILAGIRTAIVINVGFAALAFLIGGGGLGVTINSGLVNNRDSAILIGAVMVAVLALVFDFLSALAQKYMKPKGL
jgi:osmoprotectant transport system permease protein